MLLRSLVVVAMAVLAAQAAAARPSRALLQGATEPAAANAATAMQPVARVFIVAFQQHVSSAHEVSLALDRLAMSLGSQDTPATSRPVQLLRLLSPEDVPDLHQPTAEATSSTGTLGELVLLRLRAPADLKLLKASPDVAFVFRPPFTIKTPAPEVPQQPVGTSIKNAFEKVKKCSYLSSDQTVNAATSVKLVQPVACGKGSTDTLIYKGETCTPDQDGEEQQPSAPDSVRWTSAKGPDGCTIKREPSPDDDSNAAKVDKFNKDFFGDCGKEPAALAHPGSLGMRLC